MSKEMKYVIYDDCIPVLFSLATRHGTFKNLNPTSAGKCRIQYNPLSFKFNVECYGDSIDLNLKPLEKDYQKIEYMLNDY
jgi:hypothetical protein